MSLQGQKCHPFANILSQHNQYLPKWGHTAYISAL